MGEDAVAEPAMVSEPLAFVLRSGRDALNAQFAAARRQYPELDQDRFREFLASTVDGFAIATHAACPDRLPDVVMAAYELGLELVGKRLVGASSGPAVIETGWRTLAAAATPLLAAEPRRVLAALSNALHQLAVTPGARPEAWIRDLAALAPRCPDVASLLAVGQIRAWMAGLAHYRASALAVGDRLPEALALAAVGASGSWSTLRARLAGDPWFVPSIDRGHAADTLVHGVGAFRGFGGVFRAPPRIALHQGQLVVSSADEAWLLAVDAFGATFHRASPEERATAAGATLPADARWANGTLTVRGRPLAAPICGALTSVAADHTTLAVTSSLTHTIAVVALTALS
jgi:hypothetical protein